MVIKKNSVKIRDVGPQGDFSVRLHRLSKTTSNILHISNIFQLLTRFYYGMVSVSTLILNFTCLSNYTLKLITHPLGVTPLDLKFCIRWTVLNCLHQNCTWIVSYTYIFPFTHYIFQFTHENTRSVV